MRPDVVSSLRDVVFKGSALFRKVLASAVAWTYFATLLRMGAAVFVLPVVLKVLTQEHYGLWVVFGSLGGLASLLDLGFSLTATRAVGYLWAGAPRLLPFGLAPAPPPAADARQINHAYLRDLIGTLRIYYLAMGGIAFVFLLTVGGVWVWLKSEGLNGAAGLRAAWVVYVAGASLNLSGALWIALCAGVNAVQQSQKILLCGQIVYYLTAFGGLALGFGLGALAAAFFASGVTTWLTGYWFARNLLPEIPPLRQRIFNWDIIKVLWPNAWRMAGASAGTFLILQANTLICSAVLGLQATGSYGLSFQVSLLLLSLSSVWVHVKLPLINQWRAQGRTEEVARLFARRVQLSLLTFVTGAVSTLLLGPWLLGLVHARTTLLPLPALALMLLIALLEMHHSLYACLVFTENHNPFLKPALLSGAFILVLSLLLSRVLGVWGLLLSVGLVQACFNNWWPVWRAVHGLGLRGGGYWKIFLGAWHP